MNDTYLNPYVSNPALPFAIDTVGSADFYPAMLRLIGNEVAHDLLALARYTRHAPPDLVAPEDFDQDAIKRYSDGLYVMDPFYRLWGDRGSPGVVTLREVAPAGMWRSSYATEFLHDVKIHDEVCVFLPPLSGASVTLLIDRARGDFTVEERERVAALYPLLASLHALHLRTLLATAPNLGPTANGGGMPVRLIDGHGHELYKAPTWPDDPASGRAPRSRFALGSDFVLAPGGTIEYIPASNDPVSTEVRVGLIGELTSREQDIVRLTLEGYPTIAIAKKLGLAVGTVKNHRTRIFRKLDITTERELFLSVYGEKSELVLR
jgi:DNA-binding CsgD family transcriptional regulator